MAAKMGELRFEIRDEEFRQRLLQCVSQMRLSWVVREGAMYVTVTHQQAFDLGLRLVDRL
jgi:hypothetical protein